MNQGGRKQTTKTNGNKKIPKGCVQLSAYTGFQHFSSRQKLPTNLSYDTRGAPEVLLTLNRFPFTCFPDR